MFLKKDFNILSQPWAITQDCLELIAREFQLRSPEQKQDPGKNQETGTAAYVTSEQITGADVKLDINNNIAVVPVKGTLYQDDYWVGASYTKIRQQVEAAVSDSDVQAIVLRISSPGGLVSGCKELADFIFNAGKTKHIYAYADGQMCSAAYWIGSAARHIAAPVTAGIGSIGVRTLHVDWSKYNEDIGLKFTHLTAGKYKALGNKDEPLDKEAKDYFQGQLDTLYTIFVDSVAKNRRVDTKKALAMADGKVFLAEEALEIGLIDRVEQDFQSYFSLILKKEKIMDLTTLKADHPDLYSEVLEEGKVAAVAENEQKVKTAITDESKRVTDLVSAIAGEDVATKITAIVKSGASVEMVESFKELFVEDTDKEGKPYEILSKDFSKTDYSPARADILAALETAHSDGVNPEKGTENTQDKNLETKAKEFASLVN